MWNFFVIFQITRSWNTGPLEMFIVAHIIKLLALTIEAAYTSETSIDLYQMRNIREDRHLYSRRLENLKSLWKITRLLWTSKQNVKSNYSLICNKLFNISSLGISACIAYVTLQTCFIKSLIKCFKSVQITSFLNLVLRGGFAGQFAKYYDIWSCLLF